MHATRTLVAALATALLATACAAADDPPTDATAAADPDGAGGSVDDDAAAPAEDDDAEAPADGTEEHDEAQPRLVLVEESSGEVVLLDVRSWSIAGEVSLEDAVTTHGAALSEDRRYLLAPHEDGVSIVDGGAWSSRHGDHAHHHTSEPAVVGRVDGPKPSHLVSAGGRTALYFDGSGEAVLLDDERLEDGAVEPLATVPTGEPHHGFAVPLGDDLLVTVPTDDMVDMPDLVGIADDAGTVGDTYPCTKTHGEAVTDGGAAAACEDGVLVVATDGGEPDATLVPYPEVVDEDPYEYGPARAWTLVAPDGVDRLLAPLGTRHVLRVDAGTATAEAFELDAEVALFGLDADVDGRILVLTTDGAVAVLDPDDGRVLERREVIPAFTEGDPAEPFHRLVRSGEHVYVSDPTTDTVTELAVHDLAVTRTFELPVTPGYLGVVGG